MKGQKYDEAKAGVDVENFGRVPYQEEEYYEYRNWLEKYLTDHPNEADLSEEQLLTIFRNWQTGLTESSTPVVNHNLYKNESDDEKLGPEEGDSESMT